MLVRVGSNFFSSSVTMSARTQLIYCASLLLLLSCVLLQTRTARASGRTLLLGGDRDLKWPFRQAPPTRKNDMVSFVLNKMPFTVGDLMMSASDGAANFIRWPTANMFGFFNPAKFFGNDAADMLQASSNAYNQQLQLAAAASAQNAHNQQLQLAAAASAQNVQGDNDDRGRSRFFKRPRLFKRPSLFKKAKTETEKQPIEEVVNDGEKKWFRRLRGRRLFGRPKTTKPVAPIVPDISHMIPFGNGFVHNGFANNFIPVSSFGVNGFGQGMHIPNAFNGYANAVSAIDSSPELASYEEDGDEEESDDKDSEDKPSKDEKTSKANDEAKTSTTTTTTTTSPPPVNNNFNNNHNNYNNHNWNNHNGYNNHHNHNNNYNNYNNNLNNYNGNNEPRNVPYPSDSRAQPIRAPQLQLQHPPHQPHMSTLHAKHYAISGPIIAADSTVGAKNVIHRFHLNSSPNRIVIQIKNASPGQTAAIVEAIN